ncbi:RDD family protein [Belliella sp. DSM 111904]|uniref:RDD family protein n=1 Tax=Belliella filtrata TaxID=2923435 RepID=A0ABS9V2G5_9BACT|nr:RDD family protein [Belliella filtrata]MCH7410606.1 RDD family protein [Belliella filtrata]
MKEFQIKTAQNISISQNAANVGTRIGAYLIDSLIIFFYIIFAIFAVAGSVQSMDYLWSLYTLLSLPVLLYHLLFEIFMNGQSPGKMALKIRVVKLDGSKPAMSNYFIRWLTRLIDITFTSGGLAILWILISGKGQRIGDLAAGTTVISEQSPIGLRHTLLQEVAEDYVPKYPQVMSLTDRQIQNIKQIKFEALRSGDFDLIDKLAKKTASMMQVEPEEKNMSFLERVINDYNYYTQKG